MSSGGLAADDRASGEWVGQAGWLAAGAILGFAVPAVQAGVVRLPRERLVLGYLAAVGPFLYAYARRYRVDVVGEVRRRWPWGTAAAVVSALTASARMPLPIRPVRAWVHPRLAHARQVA